MSEHEIRQLVPRVVMFATQASTPTVAVEALIAAAVSIACATQSDVSIDEIREKLKAAIDKAI